MLHPAYILRGQWKHEPYQIVFLKRAKAIAESGHWESTDTDSVPPNWNLYPNMHELEEWEQGITDAGVTCDIEAAGPHITIIGFCRIHDEHGVTVRFRREGGDPWDHHPEMALKRVGWTYRLLANPRVRKVFHNGQAYDLLQLWRTGFEVCGYTDIGSDTILQLHIAYPEAPKRLEVASNVFCDLTGWKHLANLPEEGEGK